MPAASVVLPVRNGMPWLPETLDSLVAQTFEDFEVLLQDDGSTDETLACMEAYAARDARFLVESRAAAGVAAAVNRAHERARAALHVRIDGDDVAHPERLAKQVAFAQANPDVGYFGCCVAFFPEEAMGEGLRHYEAWNNGCVTHEEVFADRFVELPIANPSVAMRADVLREVGGYAHGDFPEDYDFFLRCAAAGVRFGKVPEVLLRWRDHPERATHLDERYSLASFFELKVRHIAPLLERDGRPLSIAGAGPDGKRWARRLREAGLDVQYFLDVHPGRVGQTIHGAVVCGYEDIERLRTCFVLAAVGKRGGREQVRERLSAAGFEEGVGFVCVQ